MRVSLASLSAFILVALSRAGGYERIMAELGEIR